MRRTIFDTKLFKALINIVSIFSLDSMVKLNNNEIGRVTDIVTSTRLVPKSKSCWIRALGRISCLGK